MLGYDVWGSNHSPVMLSGDDLTQDSAHPHSIIVDHYAAAAAAAGNHSTFGNHLLPGAGGGGAAFSPFFSQQQTPSSFQPMYDSRSYGAPSYSATPPATFSFHGGADSFLVPVPKTEDVVVRPPAVDWLNLGGRTNFSSSAEDDIISRLYRRSRPLEPSGGAAKVPRCQAEGCTADLTHAKHYHRRHKVCEFHSKAAAVMAAGLTQRFCQQCSRFHLLSEFDNGKRSCRKRLADHNRRRRKSQLPNNPETQKLHAGRSPTITAGLAKSPEQESGAQSSSSVTVAAASPPRMSLDCCFRPYHQAASASSSSAVSSCSLFFSTG